MLDTLLSIFAPHHCSGCGEIGTLLCHNCKYDIISEPYSACIACGTTIASKQGLCQKCRVPYEKAWCIAPRHDTIQRLIDSYKFSYQLTAYRSLADLLHDGLPELPSGVVVVPIPTVSSHIRQRGYDHTRLIARHFATKRHLAVAQPLIRATNSRQRGANARQRATQAKAAFVCHEQLDPEKTYLLIDDVVTTGATIRYAAKTLIDAGAGAVWVASISRQPLD
jgi:ComF family protein